MKRTEKEVVVDVLSERLKKAKAFILAEYRGLKVSEITTIRQEIKKNEGDFRVIKNRLAKRSMEGMVGAAINDLSPYLKGPLAIAICDNDAVAISKLLTKFAESYEVLKLKAAFFDGKILDAKGIDALAKLPSREELYSKLLGTLQAPAQGLVRVLQGVPQKLAFALKAIAEKKTS